MDVKILLLFAAMASGSPAAFGEAKHPPPPTDTYQDVESGFIFPRAVGFFQRTGMSHLKDPALWVDYAAPGTKFTIRIIVRKPEAGPGGIASCQADMGRERERVKRGFVGFSALKPPAFAGYTSIGLAEDFGPPKGGGTGYDFYYYCSRTKPWMVIYGFQRAKGVDVREQEIAFIRGVRPPGT